VISITDGQIFLETNLFNSGIRPAVDVGISVSRVGGNAQIKAMKSIAGMLRLDLAQFRELEAFAKFGSDLDKATMAQLARGRAMVEVLKQDQYVPMSIENQIAIIYAGSEGFLDDLPLEKIAEFEAGLLQYLETNLSTALVAIRDTGQLTDETGEQLKKAIDEFKTGFIA
jgi:F-type H+-transporting ATPase subunit alpha